MGISGDRDRLSMKIIRDVEGCAHTRSITSLHHDAMMHALGHRVEGRRRPDAGQLPERTHLPVIRSSTSADTADKRPSHSRARAGNFRWCTGTTGSSRCEIPEAGSSRTDRGGAGRPRGVISLAVRPLEPPQQGLGLGLAVNLTLIDSSEPHAVVALGKCLQDRLVGGTVRGRVPGVVGDEDPRTAAPGVPCPGQIAGVL
jgi:hypothetical protein